jgi:hypothetical protein
MPDNREKVVTVSLQVVILNDLELREVGFRALRDQGGPLTEMPEEGQQAANTAIQVLLLPQLRGLQIPGAQITGMGLQIAEEDRRERFGLPPLPPDPSTA